MMPLLTNRGNQKGNNNTRALISATPKVSTGCKTARLLTLKKRNMMSQNFFGALLQRKTQFSSSLGSSVQLAYAHGFSTIRQ